MARISRVVASGYPHHDTQRGVRSISIFQTDHDRKTSLDFMADALNRFGIDVLDERLLLAAVRYMELNTVAAGIVREAGDYLWSSARFHLGISTRNALVRDENLMGLIED